GPPRYVPARMSASVNDAPAARTLTHTWPGPGCATLFHHSQHLGPAEAIDDDTLRGRSTHPSGDDFLRSRVIVCVTRGVLPGEGIGAHGQMRVIPIDTSGNGRRSALERASLRSVDSMMRRHPSTVR